MSAISNRQLLGLSLLGSIAITPLLILPIMIGALVDEWRMSDSLAGWAASAGFLASALASIAVSLRVHHLDLKRLAFAGVVTLVLGNVFSAFAAEWPVATFLALRAVAGLGGGMAYAAVVSTFAREPEPDRAYGVFMTLQFALSALGLYGLPLVLPALHAEGMFLAMAGLGLLSMTLLSLLPGKPAPAEAEPSMIELRILLRKAVLFSLVGIGLFECANTIHYTYSERIGVTLALAPEQIGTVLGIATVLGIPSAYSVVWLGSRFGRLPALLGGVATSIAALLLLLTAKGLVAYTVAMCLLGMAWAFTLPYFQAIQANQDPGGSVVTAGSFTSGIGSALGPGAGAMFVGNGFASVLWLAIVIYLVTVWFMFVATRAVPRPTVQPDRTPAR